MIEQRKFRIPEAAALVNASKDLLEGWHDRGLIHASGRDTSAPGHPFVISYAELIRLAVTVELQSLFREQLATRWTPGPFLADFREVVEDRELVHRPAPLEPLTKLIEGRAADRRKNISNQAGRMKEDRILVLYYGKGSCELSVLPLQTLGAFRDNLDNLMVFISAWLTVNVSTVVRGILARAGG